MVIKCCNDSKTDSDKLMKKRLGTNKGERCARSLAKDCCDRQGERRERVRKTFLHNIMKLKKKDAEDTVKVEEQKYHQEVRKVKNIVTEESVRTRFFDFKQQEAEKEWDKTKKKLDEKGKHLEKKYKGKKDVADTMDDIKVSDKALGETKYNPEPVVLNIDKNTISQNVKQA